ncbi:hypothetical protein E2C01_100919 [Portunus trituberculatus]|uniref:Uncharacterized protein n=1 Tax=Portunus trituberculatus TaxID=210409 RepID=A0A5B7KIR4_PORTR|nr:hypothetical protein [Portunus trituberculatus]
MREDDDKQEHRYQDYKTLSSRREKNVNLTTESARQSPSSRARLKAATRFLKDMSQPKKRFTFILIPLTNSQRNVNEHKGRTNSTPPDPYKAVCDKLMENVSQAKAFHFHESLGSSRRSDTPTRLFVKLS